MTIFKLYNNIIKLNVNNPSIQQPLYPIPPQNDLYQPPIYQNTINYQNPPVQNYAPIPTQPPIINQPIP